MWQVATVVLIQYIRNLSSQLLYCHTIAVALIKFNEIVEPIDNLLEVWQ